MKYHLKSDRGVESDMIVADEEMGGTWAEAKQAAARELERVRREAEQQIVLAARLLEAARLHLEVLESSRGIGQYQEGLRKVFGDK